MRSSLIYSLLLLAAVGCRPSVDSEELGDVIYELPNVPGAEEPYKLPNLAVEQEPKTEKSPEVKLGTPDPASPPVANPLRGEQPEKGSSSAPPQ